MLLRYIRPTLRQQEASSPLSQLVSRGSARWWHPLFPVQALWAQCFCLFILTNYVQCFFPESCFEIEQKNHTPTRACRKGLRMRHRFWNVSTSHYIWYIQIQPQETGHQQKWKTRNTWGSNNWKICWFLQVTQLTSPRRHFILTKPHSFFNRQLALTICSHSSGAFPRLFLVMSSSICSRSGSTGGTGLPSSAAMRVRIGINSEAFLQHPWTSSVFPSGWKKVSPSLSLDLMSSHSSHWAQSPATSRISVGGAASSTKDFPLRFRTMGICQKLATCAAHFAAENKIDKCTHVYPKRPIPRKCHNNKNTWKIENSLVNDGDWCLLNLMDFFLLPPCMLQDISLSARLIGFAGPTEKNSGRARQCIEFVGGETIWPYILSINLFWWFHL